MKVKLIKEVGEPSRMSTVLKTIATALVDNGYEIKEINHEAGYLIVNPDRGPFPVRRVK